MKRSLSVFLIVSLLIACVLPIPAAADETDSAPGHVFEARQVSVVLPDSDVACEATCLFFDDLPNVPYVCAGDYCMVFSDEITSEPSVESGVYTYSRGDSVMTVDANNDTISFTCHEQFISRKMTDAVSDIFSYLYDTKPVQLDLAKYGIDIVEYEGRPYLPYCTLNNIFSDSYSAVLYENEALTYIPDTYERYMGGKGIARLKYSDTRTQAMIDLTYNELCLVMDTTYGCPSRCVLADSIRENGFDSTLRTYSTATAKIRDMLLSESMEEYCEGITLLDYYMNDGGHTNLSAGLEKPLKKYGIEDVGAVAEKVFGETEPETAAQIVKSVNEEPTNREKSAHLGQEKRALFNSMEVVKEWSGIKLYRSGSTYIFDFNTFTEAVCEPFKWSLDYAKDNNAVNFIVDLTTNNGGLLDVGQFMTKLMCGDNTRYIRFAMSGNMAAIKTDMDLNFDGKTDEQDDAIRYDFRFAILTSRNSFSCGSMTPSICQQHGIAIIGETSGGGCCNIIPHYNPDGSVYTTSGNMVITDSQGVDVDKGATVAAAFPGADEYYNGFYDLDKMNEAIAEFYGDELPAKTGIYGDVDSDGSITANDALMILRQSVGSEDLGADALTLADVDGDGSVTANDALAVLRNSVGMTDDNNVGKPMAA